MDITAPDGANNLRGMIHPSHPTKLQHKVSKGHFVQYFSTPATPCDSQFENASGRPRATVNLKILLDSRCDIQFENTPGPPCATVTFQWVSTAKTMSTL